MDTSDSADADRQRRHSRYDCSAGCPVEAALEVISGKWKGLALYHLRDTALRFTELKRAVGDVTPRTLVKQLRELEADGLVDRVVFAVVPSRVEYSLTAKGEALVPVILALGDWGVTFAIPPTRHASRTTGK